MTELVYTYLMSRHESDIADCPTWSRNPPSGYPTALLLSTALCVAMLNPLRAQEVHNLLRDALFLLRSLDRRSSISQRAHSLLSKLSTLPRCILLSHRARRWNLALTHIIGGRDLEWADGGGERAARLVDGGGGFVFAV